MENDLQQRPSVRCKPEMVFMVCTLTPRHPGTVSLTVDETVSNRVRSTKVVAKWWQMLGPNPQHICQSCSASRNNVTAGADGQQEITWGSLLILFGECQRLKDPTFKQCEYLSSISTKLYLLLNKSYSPLIFIY